ncbi:hypothetical protein BDV98DRAFT_133693 [Pterulicium gracile]|uniref:Conidiation protein 6-domain-containing protein n=1 Tax=Pterulicium gracile TaxID=1884261 RepID=A0A5C3QCA8_9AGAR|nr:hypothetical protein BDV98DRAFT_133693 [Pterula gracilis]
MSKNPGNVAGGLKATMNNPNVSDEAKDNAKERLDQLEHGANVDDVASSGSSSKASGEKNPGNVIGGLKGALNNPNNSEETKAQVQEKLDAMQ